MTVITQKEIKSAVKPRDPKANKGNFGKLLIIAGCTNYRGAAYLASVGALRSGVGILSLASTEKVLSSVSAKVSECTYFPLSENSEGAISADNGDSVLDHKISSH